MGHLYGRGESGRATENGRMVYERGVPRRVHHSAFRVHLSEDNGKPSESGQLAEWIGTNGEVDRTSNDLKRRYELSFAARFWGVTPWELERRPDAPWWIAEAFTMQGAESEGQRIAVEIEKKRQAFRNGKT